MDLQRHHTTQVIAQGDTQTVLPERHRRSAVQSGNSVAAPHKRAMYVSSSCLQLSSTLRTLSITLLSLSTDCYLTWTDQSTVSDAVIVQSPGIVHHSKWQGSTLIYLTLTKSYRCPLCDSHFHSVFAIYHGGPYFTAASHHIPVHEPPCLIAAISPSRTPLALDRKDEMAIRILDRDIQCTLQEMHMAVL